MKKTVILHGAPLNGAEIEIDPAYMGPRDFYEPADDEERYKLLTAFPMYPDMVAGERPRTVKPDDKVCTYIGMSRDKRWGIGVYGTANNEADADLVEFADSDDVPKGTAYYFKDGKLHFTEEGLRHFTEDERNQLVGLHEQHAKKFDEICDFVADKLGYGPKDTLSEEQKARVVEEAEELTERWDEDVETSEDPEQWKKAAAPAQGLQALLAAHHELGERIMDIRDGAVAPRSMGG